MCNHVHLQSVLLQRTPYTDRQTFNAALASLAPDGKWRHAAALVSDMMAQGDLPDELSCDAAFTACERASQGVAAVSYLRTVQRFGERLLLHVQKDLTDAGPPGLE